LFRSLSVILTMKLALNIHYNSASAKSPTHPPHPPPQKKKTPTITFALP
jgi:hypothetical protein